MSRLTLVAMALVLSMAGSALANDGTKLIYDLTELGHKTPVSRSSEMFEGHGMPDMGATPRTSPTGPSELSIDWTGGSFELSHRRGRPQPRTGSTAQNTLPSNNDRPYDATPNPEPGTLLLMGSGVAAGARFLRRRKNTNR